MDQPHGSVWRRRRYSRRGVLRGAGVGLAGALAAGCTTTSGPAPTATTASAAAPSASVGPAPVATSAAQPKYGGNHQVTYGPSDAPHLDPHQTNSAALLNQGVGIAWSQLLWYK